MHATSVWWFRLSVVMLTVLACRPAAWALSAGGWRWGVAAWGAAGVALPAGLLSVRAIAAQTLARPVTPAAWAALLALPLWREWQRGYRWGGLCLVIGWLGFGAEVAAHTLTPVIGSALLYGLGWVVVGWHRRTAATRLALVARAMQALAPSPGGDRG
jgi:hypothetical protein